MTYSLVNLYSNTGHFPIFDEHYLVEHERYFDVEALVRTYLTGKYEKLEQVTDETTVFVGHKDGKFIILTIASIVRVSPEEAEILRRFIPTMERE